MTTTTCDRCGAKADVPRAIVVYFAAGLLRRDLCEPCVALAERLVREWADKKPE